MKSFLGNLSVVSGATLASRILGLLRDILFFSTFGASVIGEAFLLAFTIPNLFRRMLGEGTLNSAFVPVFSQAWHKFGKERAWAVLNQIISRMVFYLGGFVVMIAAVSWLGTSFSQDWNPKWNLAGRLNMITFGYLALICTSAILVGVLNVRGHFWEGAISPVILNTCMILCLVLSHFLFGGNLWITALILSSGVLVAGGFQLFLPWLSLILKEKWKWRCTLSQSEELQSVKSLFWVGALGAAVAQVNLLVSRFLAYSLDETGSLSYLYMAARLVELPLGVFAISVSTVLFPKLTNASAKGDLKKYKQSLFLGMRIIGAVTLPASVGLYILAEPILSLFFQWNEFGVEQTHQASRVLMVAAWTIPLYAYSTFLVKGFHSEKNMKTPFHGALISLVVNVCTSLLLMEKMGVLGLAWANLISALFQMFFLFWKKQILSFSDWFNPSSFSICSPVVGCIGIYFFLEFSLPHLSTLDGKLADLIILLMGVSLSTFIYFLILKMLKFEWGVKFFQHNGS